MTDQPTPAPAPPATTGPGSFTPATIGGCSLMLIFLMVCAILGIGVLTGDDDDPCAGDATSLVAASAHLSAGGSCPDDGASPDDPEDSPDSTDTPDSAAPSGSATDGPSEDAGGSGQPQTSADLPEDGVGTPGGSYVPPAEEDLPADAVLYTGSSGDQIGCITCDGASRFLSIEGPGVVVGDTGMTSQATTWEEDGQILEFGANLSGPNKGRYGVALFTGPATYLAGCSLEIGSRSCLQARPGPITEGTAVVIIIGEGGTLANGKPASKGDFVVDWWFVFQPD